MIALALLAWQAAAAPSVTLVVQPPVGLTDAEAKKVDVALAEELAALGVSVVRGKPLDAACAPELGCVQAARGQAPALLVVELIKIGPVLQVSAVGAAAANFANGQRSVEKLQPPLLAEGVRAWLKTLPPTPDATKAGGDAGHGGSSTTSAGTGTGTSAGGTGSSTTTKTTTTPASPPGSSTAPFELTPLKSGAIFAAGVGAVVAIGGVLLWVSQDGVLNDPKTSGEQKAGARTLGLAGVAATVVGFAGIGTGVGLFFVE